MRKALFILGDLNEDDIVFLSHAGSIRELTSGEALIRAGHAVEALYFLTRGAMAVRLGDGSEVAQLGIGDVTGEMSFVENRLPEADVVATDACRLLAVPRAAIDAELAANPAFAARFYKALATFLSDRLRTMTASRSTGGGAGDELDERLLDMVHVAGDRMLRLIELLDRDAQA